MSKIKDYVDISHDINKHGYLAINVVFNKLEPVTQFGQSLIVNQSKAKAVLDGLLWQSNDYPDDSREHLTQVLQFWMNPQEGCGQGRTRVLFYFQGSDDIETRKQQIANYIQTMWEGSPYQRALNSGFVIWLRDRTTPI